MELTPEQKVAKRMYVQGETVKRIALELDVNKSTIYRWIDNKELGFKKDKLLQNYSVEGLSELLIEAHKEALIEVHENPTMLLNPATADSLIKVVNAIKKMEKDVDYLGVTSDIIKKMTEIVKEEMPEHLEAFRAVIPLLMEKLQEEYS